MDQQATVVRCVSWGRPEEVLRVETEPLGPVGPNQVRVEMRGAPINPADFNIIQGAYGRLPTLPAVIGHEGAGVVTEVGHKVSRVKVGQRVRPVPGVGTWRSGGVFDETDLWHLPAGLTDDQAAMISVNPATAYRLLRDFVPLKPGDWVIQNAANSAVGRHVIQLARHFKLRTFNVVRREELIGELEQEGATRVVASEDGLHERLREATSGVAPRLALNAVGGGSGVALARSLGPGGTLVTYGAMGRMALRIGGGLLIFNELCVRGFWISAWYERATAEARNRMLENLAGLFAEGVLVVKVAQRYPLSQVLMALEAAQAGPQRGKVMLGARALTSAA